ncbi:MAG: Gfo/Idh/MocA family oxidoreductase, partial [Candidatus Hydrogenedentes bacterium]|nr:Gfo/Idh/MocA family oxidoreductase [Candidatus Hydrogenedentota bacterium]
MAVNRIVVVGCGSIGQRHARLLARRGNLCVELCDTAPDCLAEAVASIGDRKTYRDYREALASRPDAIVVATPHAEHAGPVIAALDAGVHVLCEKPMADNLADAQRMAAAARDGQCVLDFGFTLHFHPGLRRLKELVGSGALGNIVHIYCRVGTYATLASSRTRHQAALEGALLFDYVHQPDICYWLTNAEPSAVYLFAARAGELPLCSNPNVADIILEYDTGLRACIHLNYLQAPQRHEYEVVGDRAWAKLDMEANELHIGRRNDATVTTERFEIDRDRVFEAEHQAFFDAVDG